MTNVIYSTYGNLVILTGGADNPTTITATGILGAGVYASSLDAAWTISNAGSVLGAGLTLGSAGTVTNAGSVAGASAAGYGVLLQAGGSVTNQSDGTISGGFGVAAFGGTGTVVNDGWIAATRTTGSGVFLLTGGAVANAASATITGASQGVNILFGPGYVTNVGTILGTGAGGFGSFLNDGGSVTNAAFGVMEGGQAGVQIQGGIGVVDNAGTISGYRGTLAAGISLSSYGGSVVNAASGVIDGYSCGVLIGGGPVVAASGTVVNYGRITGTRSNAPAPLANAGYGVSFFDMSLGATITNGISGSIVGTRDGIMVSGGAGTVINDGSIAATGIGAERYQDGVFLGAGGSVANSASGWITGSGIGVLVGTGTGTILNAGVIGGANAITGVDLNAGGDVINQASGTIGGGAEAFWGIEIAGGAASVTNAGTIQSIYDAVDFAAGFDNALTVEPGAVFVGAVDGGNAIGATAVSTLELAAGTGAGTLTGLGSQFVNFGSIVFDPGALWSIAGDAAGLAGTISGFAAGDTIDVSGITVTASNYAAGVLTLDDASGTVALDLPGNGFTTADFAVTNTAGGAEIALDTVTLHGASGEYTIADDNGALYVQDNGTAGDGTQTLPSVTEMLFTDGTGVFDPTGTAEDVARLYGAAFNRFPDLGGLQYWTAQINSGSISLATAADEFTQSAEFQQDYGTPSDASFVNQLYENVLGRPADQAGLQYWEQQLADGASRGQVLLGFAESEEYINDKIAFIGDPNYGEAYRLYQAALDRAPDPAGLAYWVDQMQGGLSPIQAAQGFVDSAEFQTDYGSLSINNFVSLMYENVLHRPPDPTGFQYWTNMMDQGASQATVLLGFSDSAENRVDTAAATHDGWVFIPTPA